jgi:NAD+-dependent protein deacetylase sirtuin 2
MYSTLRPELLTATNEQKQLMSIDPTYVVSWDIFKDNSLPYLEVRKPFIIGTLQHKWKATIGHLFFNILEKKFPSKLTRWYTQNIDGLEYQCTNIPSSKLIPVHGSIAQASCENCGHDITDYTKFCNNVQTSIKDIYNIDDTAPKVSTPIICEKCSKPLVKPKTVLFGRSLPSNFFTSVQNDLPNVDLLIIAGTSLVVSPANSVVYSVPDTTYRVIINNEPVGSELGIDYSDPATSSNRRHRDIFLQGTCDEIFLELIEHLGWLQDIQQVVDVLPPDSAKLINGKAYKSWF